MKSDTKIQSVSMKTLARELSEFALEHHHAKMSLIALSLLDDERRGLDLDAPSETTEWHLRESLDYITRMLRDDVRKNAKPETDETSLECACRWFKAAQLIAAITTKLKAVVIDREGEERGEPSAPEAAPAAPAN